MYVLLCFSTNFMPDNCLNFSFFCSLMKKSVNSLRQLKTEHFFGIFFSQDHARYPLSVQFPTTVFVYIHRNQSSNHSTGNKGPIGKNKGPGSENVHSSEFEILALYIYIIVYNITRGYSVGLMLHPS